jgi:beta-lactamase class D
MPTAGAERNTAGSRGTPTSETMGNMNRLLTIAILLFSVHAHATNWMESREIAELFSNAELKGTFVLYDVAAHRFVGYDQARAERRFVPASTFKIPNTLIGLSVGAVGSIDEVLPYGGQPQPFKAWEKDMGLRDAIAISNVRIFQELARRIGLDRMRQGVSNLGYGNNEIGTKVDTFWLDGPLKISAVEQTLFLAKLAQEALPVPRALPKSARDIILVEQGAHWRLYGKTGWENAPGPGVGWWVGWVVKDDRVYAFALNIDIQKASDASRRVELGRASLKALGIL